MAVAGATGGSLKKPFWEFGGSYLVWLGAAARKKHNVGKFL